MTRNDTPHANAGGTNRIETVTELLRAEFERIRLAEVKLQKQNPQEQIAGRIIERWNQQDLTLRYRGHEHDVPNAHEWDLVRFQPATSIERRMIEQRWS